jgi:hypothetical protein
MFKSGKMEGNGVMKWKTGDRYDGQWKNDQMNGQGTMRYASGMTVKGNWKDGKPVTESKADTEAARMAGMWQEQCKCVPSQDDKFGCGGVSYEFTADGKGTCQMKSEGGINTYPISWKLKGTVLTITIITGDSKDATPPKQYTYDALKKWYADKPAPHGPFGKVMHWCVIKKGTAR